MEVIKKHYRLILYSIPVISFLLHFHVFNMDLVGIHVWRQTETQTTINNFYHEDMNILNPRFNEHPDTSRLHRMEFPVMQWLFALFYKLFGSHIIISRLLTFIIGLFSVYGMYKLCYSISHNKVVATLCGWCFNFSPVFYYYTVNPMPDNMALCCGIWSIGHFYNYINSGKIKYVVWSAMFLCLATMSKLPFVIYASFIATFLLMELIKKNLSFRSALKIGSIYLVCILPAAAWYVWVIPGWVIGAVHGVFDQSLNHPVISNVIFGTLVSVLPELVVNYASVLFFLTGFYVIYYCRLYKRRYFLPFAVWGIIIGLYFLFEMNIIDLVHDYYLFPFLPPVFILVGYGGNYLMRRANFLKYVALLCLILLPLTAYLRADSRWDTGKPGFNAAYYKYKDELRNLTPKDALCVVGYDESHYILLYYIDRKGWAFDKSWFDLKVLEYYISKGATYIFLDDDVENIKGVRNHLGEKVFDKETLRVYKLK